MSKELSRRDFIKGAASGAIGVAAMGVMAGSEISTAAASDIPVTSSDSSPEIRYNVDILIIGGGMAGLSAGIRAMELGYDNILIIDKSGGEGYEWGGSSMVSGGSFLIPVSNSDSDVEAYAQAIFEKGLEKGDIDLINTLAAGAWDAYQWLMELGVEYSEPKSVFPAYPAVLTVSASMFDAMDVMRDHYTDAGGTIIYNCKAVKLNYDSSGISGALAQGTEDYFNIKAKKTVLCTGGYAANKQFLEDHIGEKASDLMCRARSSATGDGIYLAQAAGGCTINSTGLKTVHLSAVDPVYKEQGQPGNDIPYMIAINSEGKRFVDEALGSVRHGQAVFQQAVQKDGLIFDSKVTEEVAATMEKLHNQGVVTWETNTIEEMAEIFGVDAETLADTVNDFNAHVNSEDEITEGLEVDKTAKAKTIDSPPFYGIYPLVPGTSLTFGGLATSTNAEVLQADGKPVANLYAAGEGTGGFFYDDYFGGTCMARCVVFGHIAAEQAIEGLK